MKESYVMEVAHKKKIMRDVVQLEWHLFVGITWNEICEESCSQNVAHKVIHVTGVSSRITSSMELKAEVKSAIKAVTEKQNPCLEVAHEIICAMERATK